MLFNYLFNRIHIIKYKSKTSYNLRDYSRYCQYRIGKMDIAGVIIASFSFKLKEAMDEH